MACIEQLYTGLVRAAPGELPAVARQSIADDANWHVAHPVNDLRGIGAIVSHFLEPLRRALPDLERRPYISLAGEDSGQYWVDGTGYFSGTFRRPLFGIPPTGGALFLRYTEMARIVDGRIAEYYLIPDFLDAMRQAGVYPLAPPRGTAELVPPPATMDGLYRPVADPAHGADSRALVMAMLDCLRTYDGERLESMALEHFWDPDFHWYGPGGIGTTRGIAGFREFHQGPFLRAFPDRDVDHHASTIACGDFVATGGWPHMHGTHSGDGWLGTPASGRHLGMRVMDIWRRQGDRLRENWVAIDIPHMLMQMGKDIFAQADQNGGSENHG